MAVKKPEVEWFFNTNTFWRTYGLINLSRKWAVVKFRESTSVEHEYDLITDWLDDRKTAVGFLKILMGE